MPDPERLSEWIRDALRADASFAFCDACLALPFAESLEDARAAALLVAREHGFIRKVRVCDDCTRAVEMTVLTT